VRLKGNMGWVSMLPIVLGSIFLLSDMWVSKLEVEAARMPQWAKKYTRSQKGCPCWFDLSKGTTECACCHNKGIQCGYPMQMYCQRDARRPQYRIGCPGIQNRQDTLSEQGHPCHHDIHDKSCGWCGLSSQQCNGWNHLYNKNIKCGYLTAYAPGARKRGDGFCLGQVQDCRLSPSYCDVNAVCVDTKRKIKGIYGGKAYRCACKQGFIGNGITCADAASGTIEANQDMIVNMHMELGRTITIERAEPDFPIGDATTKFENELKSLRAAGDGKEVFCNGN